MRHARKLSLIIAATLAAAGLLLAALLNAGSPTPSAPPSPAAQAPAPDRSHEKPASIRTLAVFTDAEPAPSARPECMRALLVKGTLPGGFVEATVLTDEDCAPDRHGVSHCRNKLRLPNGKTITVRHPHRMHDVPCMTPGETVRVRRAVDA